MSLLERINAVGDVKKIPEEKLKELAKEIRGYLIRVISENGGHLAPNLGVVELTIALHRYLDLPKDKLIWDVGHQSYVHKILTGRKKELRTLRKLGGISGFPKRQESDCDFFDTGHASTSVSAALGYAAARDIAGGKEKVALVIGDGAMTGGMALEALNNAGNLKSNLIIVLNDNEMSIAENVGGVAKYLGKIRTSHGYLKLKNEVKQVVKGIPCVGNRFARKLKVSKDSIKRLFVPGMFFEDMGLTYLGPIDGHDLHDLGLALRNAGRAEGPVLVHVITKKGKGYRPAMNEPEKFHGIDPFDLRTGEVKKKGGEKSYTGIFSETMLSLAKEEPKLVAITAAMPFGTGLYEFKEHYPNRFFDVGIAEQHAVTFAAGLAAAGMKPVVAIYSTFLQRAYDQILHDVCIQELPVVFAIDRAGLVGSDGETHQGIFDVGYLSTIPGLTVMSPRDGKEFREMLRFAVELGKPVAIRYPRGAAVPELPALRSELVLNKSEVMHEGKKVAILTSGKLSEMGFQVKELLNKKKIDPTLINIRFLNHIDDDELKTIKENHSLIAVLEENVFAGSYAERLAGRVALLKLSVDVLPFTLPNSFIPHGTTEELQKIYGLSPENVAAKIEERLLKTGKTRKNKRNRG